MKKVLLSVLVIGAFVFYSLHERFGFFSDDDAELVSVVGKQTSYPVSQATAAPTITTTEVSTTPSPVVKTTAALFKDGTYTGPSSDAYYGNVQVKVVVSGGRITDVVFLDYPQDRRTSILINQQAIPLLKEEAITAQSANVDTISGASQTTRGFRASLSGALAQAKI